MQQGDTTNYETLAVHIRGGTDRVVYHNYYRRWFGAADTKYYHGRRRKTVFRCGGGVCDSAAAGYRGAGRSG